MICKKCGAEIADGSKFCTECGVSIEEPKKMKQNSLGFEGDVVPPKFDKEEEPVSEPKKKNPMVKYVIIGLVVAVIGFIGYSNSNTAKYSKACKLLESGSYTEAVSYFDELSGDDYKDSYDKLYECYYGIGNQCLEYNDFDNAKSNYQKANGYQDSANKIMECDYLEACYLKDQGKYQDAIEKYNFDLNYEDYQEVIKECKYLYAQENMENIDYYDKEDLVYVYLKELKDMKYKDSADLYKQAFSYEYTITSSDQMSEILGVTGNKKEFSIGLKEIYFEFYLSKGVPEEEVDFSYDIKSDGYSVISAVKKNKLQTGYSYILTLDITEADPGKATIYLYANDKEITTYSFTLTN